MKTKKQNTADSFPSFTPSKTLIEITNDFVKKQANRVKDDDENNQALQAFSNVARFIVENQKSVNFNNFLAMTRNLDTSASELAPLFHLWLAELKVNNRVNEVSGCYDWKEWVFK